MASASAASAAGAASPAAPAPATTEADYDKWTARELKAALAAAGVDAGWARTREDLASAAAAARLQPSAPPQLQPAHADAAAPAALGD